MPKIDVCLEMVFTDLPYERRIAEIAKAGFNAVEFWFNEATFDGKTCSKTQPKDAAVLRDVCRKHGVCLHNMVVNAPDGSFGGSPVCAGDRRRYLDRLEEVIDFAKIAGCKGGITCSGNIQPGLSRARMRANLERALGDAAEIAARKDFVLFLEPLNIHVDHVGYYLHSSAEAAAIVRAIGNSSLRLLYDIYHMQIMEGNILATIKRNLDLIGHFHAAGVPGRHELMSGEINYGAILRALDDWKYRGFLGLEYIPAGDSRASLRSIRMFLDDAMRKSAQT